MSTSGYPAKHGLTLNDFTSCLILGNERVRAHFLLLWGLRLHFRRYCSASAILSPAERLAVASCEL